MDKAFLWLQRLLEKKVRVFWHKNYFEKYCKNHITPWKQMFSNLQKMYDSLKFKWEHNLQNCSFEMMTILCHQYQSEIADLDTQINAWYVELVFAISTPLFIQREKDLREQKEYTSDLINIK